MLGDSGCVVGNAGDIDRWTFHNVRATTEFLPLYGISEVLTVVDIAAYSPVGEGCDGVGVCRVARGESHNMTATGQNSFTNSNLFATGGFTGPCDVTEVRIRTEGDSYGQATVAIWTADANFVPIQRVSGAVALITSIGAHRTYSAPMPVSLGSGNYVLVHSVDFRTKHPNADGPAGGELVQYCWNTSPTSGGWRGPFTDSWKFEVVATGPSNKPALSGTEPRLNQSLALLLGCARPNLPCAVLFGASTSTWSGSRLPMSLAFMGRADRDLLVSPDLSLSAATDGFGTLNFSFNIPNDPTLYGGPFHNQAVIFDTVGIHAVSNAATATIGR